MNGTTIAVDWHDLPFHPVANLFPLIDGPEFDALVSDIAANGLHEPIWLHSTDNTIIDGRNRYRACLAAGVTPTFRRWDGNGGLTQFVLSLNLHRRHLTSSQRAAVAVEVLPWLEEEARTRQIAALKQNANAPLVKELTNDDDTNAGRAAAQAAELLGTNRQYVSDMKKLNAEAPALFAAVRAGEMSVPEAVRQARPHVAFNSGNNEWYTPRDYITAARNVMGSIDLDPASSVIANEVVRAAAFYTAEDDGLSQHWEGNVWMNPPYAGELIGRFAEKLIFHVDQYDVRQAVVLVNNATETAWFRSLIDAASAVVFPANRVKFWKPDGDTGAPLQGQAVVYIGDQHDRFLAEFGRFGWGAIVYE